VLGWGWYYLSTILDNYSGLELCEDMKVTDMQRTVDRVIQQAGLKEYQRPKLLSDNSSCYITLELKGYLKNLDI